MIKDPNIRVPGNDDADLRRARDEYHRRPQAAAKEASDPRFQDQLSAKLAELTGVSLF